MPDLDAQGVDCLDTLRKALGYRYSPRKQEAVLAFNILRFYICRQLVLVLVYGSDNVAAPRCDLWASNAELLFLNQLGRYVADFQTFQ